jgi:hypothetical protein
MREIGFLDAARQGQFTFLLFHILGSSVASLEEIADIAPNAPRNNYYVVKNLIGDGSYFEWDPDTYNAYFDAARSATEITVTRLNELAYSAIDLAGAPFSEFAYSEAQSFVLRGYVRSWLMSIGRQLDRAELATKLTDRAVRKDNDPPTPLPTAAPGDNLGRLEEVLLERLRALDQSVKGN